MPLALELVGVPSLLLGGFHLGAQEPLVLLKLFLQILELLPLRVDRVRFLSTAACQARDGTSSAWGPYLAQGLPKLSGLESAGHLLFESSTRAHLLPASSPDWLGAALFPAHLLHGELHLLGALLLLDDLEGGCAATPTARQHHTQRASAQEVLGRHVGQGKEADSASAQERLRTFGMG